MKDERIEDNDARVEVAIDWGSNDETGLVLRKGNECEFPTGLAKEYILQFIAARPSAGEDEVGQPTKAELRATLHEVKTWAPNEPTRPHVECIIKVLEASLSAMRDVRGGGEGWRDISTVPRDGRFIIVYRPLARESNDDEITIKRGVSENNFCWECTIPEGCEPVNYTDGACYPTHWMPLPTAPEGE